MAKMTAICIAARFRFVVLTALILGLSGAGSAHGQYAMPEDGLSGFVTVMPGVASIESQFQTDDDNRVTTDLSNSGDSTTEVVPLILGEARYTVTDWRLQVYAGLPIENVREGNFLQAEIGGRYWLGDGTRLSAAFLPQPLVRDETWSEPFVTNAPRQKTDFDVWGIRLRADQIAGSMFGLRYEYGKADIDEEQSGQFLASQPGGLLTQGDVESLRRDADFHRVTATYSYRLSERWWLRPALRYSFSDADGESNGFDGIRPELGILYVSNDFDSSLNLLYEHRWFDKSNPVFGRKRDDDSYRAIFAFGYKRPFDWEDFRWEIFAVYSRQDSDVEFYDSEAMVLGTGLTYQF